MGESSARRENLEAVVWQAPERIPDGRAYVIVSLAENRVLAAVKTPGKRLKIRDPWGRQVVIVISVWGRTLTVVRNFTNLKLSEALLKADKVIKHSPCVKFI